MNYKIIGDVQADLTPLEQILIHRGIPKQNIKQYINANLNDVNKPEQFGKAKLDKAVKTLITHISNNDKAIIIIDPDVDGNTSAALFLNYLNDLFPAWTQNNIEFYFHQGKQHGLNDCIQTILNKNCNLILIPDAGSNDTIECKQLIDLNKDVIILDHHDYDKENPYAIIINNQDGYSDYPNKALSGVGVVWQFCRYIDKLMNVDYSSKYLDLVAIGLIGDMMDLRSIETKALVKEGLQSLKNPFIYFMAQKNAFKLGEKITPIGAAFYIVPLLNAVQRSGTQEEKELVFNSMLNYKAFNQILSTKRGHMLNETEQLVEQAVRTASNVKNRQTRVQDSAVEQLENKIQNEHLLDHKVLLILLDDNNIPAEIKGLIANKFMAKYQRPCCLLSKVENAYAGSARGCSLAGIDDFKQVCLDTENVDYAVGHPNAFGIKLDEKNIPTFIEKTDKALENMSDQAFYYVDYIFNNKDINAKVILDIAEMADYWGSEIDEALVAVKDIKITQDMVDIYRKTTNTIKITIPNGVNLMKFDASEELCDKLTTGNSGFISMDIVGKCNKNEWNGNITAQIFIEDFNIIDSNKYYF